MALFVSTFALHAQQIKPVNSNQVNTMLQKEKDWVVLDVRTPEEFKAGHIKGAVNIDIRQTDAFAKLDKLNHKAKYIVHCRTSHRSKVAVDYMAKKGFTTVYQMMDGMNGWNEQGLAVVK